MHILLLRLLGVPAALAAPVSSADAAPDASQGAAPAVQQAAQAELARSMTMKLPDQPSPYLVAYEVLDGQVATAQADFGALVSTDDGPYRTLRVDVRVGDYALDNTNFDGNFGDRSGIGGRLLPDEDDVLALRRELWLATDAAYKGATEQLSGKLSARQGSNRSFGPDLYREPGLVTPALARPPAEVAPLEALTRALSARLVGHGYEEGTAIARDWQGVRMLVSSEGAQTWAPTGFTVVRVEAVARADDGARLRDTRSWVAATPAGLPSQEAMLAQVDDMMSWLDGLKQAPIEEDYLGPVLFEEPAAVEMFRQLLAPELSGTPAPEHPPEGLDDGEEVPTARIGRRLLPQRWSVVDDPLAADEAHEPGGYQVDFEGVAAQRVEAVEDGVVRQVLMSRVPRQGIEGSNGHGRSLGADRREGVVAAVTVRPAHPRGERRLERKGLALAKDTVQPYLLVVRRLEPPALAEDFHVAFSGDAPLPGLTRPSEAYRLYADGRREPVRGLEFVGVDRRVMRDIAVAGRTGPSVGVMDAPPGGRRYNIGPVGGLPCSWAAPAVVLSELELHGTGGHEQRALPPPPEAAAAVAAVDVSPPEAAPEEAAAP